MSKTEQLIMRCIVADAPREAVLLPPGVQLIPFPAMADAVNVWLDIVCEGLTETRRNEDFYIGCMKEHDGYQEEYCFFLTENGTPAATLTVIPNEETKEGYIHMVACREAFRGRGYGTLLNRVALRTLRETGMKCAYLTTDDWRIPAIKSYLRAGFIPDTTTPEFAKRWQAVFAEIDGMTASFGASPLR